MRDAARCKAPRPGHADGRTVTFRARVRAYGRQHRLTFGTNHEGWNEERVRVELDEILRQIERGTWEPPSRKPDPAVMVEDDETLHVTASRWWGQREPELAPKSRVDYRWLLNHLLRLMARDASADIDVRRVDWLRAQLRERELAPRSVNMVLDCLAQVPEDAVDYELLDTNPARGKHRRMRLPQSRRTFLEPDQVVDLLDAAGRWKRVLLADERIARPRHPGPPRDARHSVPRRTPDQWTDRCYARATRCSRRAPEDR